MRVLIVDDQEVNREQLSTIVQGFGYTCLTVDSGNDAVDVVSDFKPDVVLLDVLMPGMSGYEVAPRLKSYSGDVHLPIIFITALDDQSTLLRCLEAGGDDFVSKPFDSVVLEAKLKAHLRTRELSLTIADKNQTLAYHSSRMQLEHQIVRNMFRNALSQNLWEYPHLETFFLPLSTFNGDIFLVAQGPGGNLYVMMGDFTGHGLPAAIGTLPASQAFFSMAGRGDSISAIAREINNHLYQLLPEDMFCGAVLLELSASGEWMSWWNGGMPPPLLLNPESHKISRLEAQHMALGILSEAEFDHRATSQEVEPGSRLLLYTDGVIELKSRDDKLVDIEGLEELGRKHEWQLPGIAQSLNNMLWFQTPKDDVSLALLHCQPAPEPERTKERHYTVLPFKVEVRIELEKLKQIDPISRVLQGMGLVHGFRRHKAMLFMLLSEAYNNAIEHGLLGLDSNLKSTEEGFEEYYMLRAQRLAELKGGEVLIAFDYQPDKKLVKFTVSNNGEGFEPPDLSARDEATEENLAQSHGRGIWIMSELANNIHWTNNGRSLHFDYDMS